MDYEVQLRILNNVLLAFVKKCLYAFDLVLFNQCKYLKMCKRDKFNLINWINRSWTLGGSEENAEGLHPDVARPSVRSFGQKWFEQIVGRS